MLLRLWLLTGTGVSSQAHCRFSNFKAYFSKTILLASRMKAESVNLPNMRSAQERLFKASVCPSISPRFCVIFKSCNKQIW